MECGSPWPRRRTSVRVERVSLITQADYRNVVIFPEKFDGLYARLDRPHSEIAPWSIWISYSPDLRFWGQSQLIMRPEPYHWDEMKIGPGAPPIKTDRGWLSIYHGVFRTMDGASIVWGLLFMTWRTPPRSSAWATRGLLSDWPKAIDSFKRSLRLKWDITEAYNNLGYAYSRTGNVQQATAAFNALEHRPDYWEACFNLATCAWSRAISSRCAGTARRCGCSRGWSAPGTTWVRRTTPRATSTPR